MANIYTNIKTDLTTNNNTSIFTVPAATTAIVKSFIVSNDSSSNDSIEIQIVSTSDATFNLFKSQAINANSSVDLLTNPLILTCLLYTSPSPRDRTRPRMPSSA